MSLSLQRHPREQEQEQEHFIDVEKEPVKIVFLSKYETYEFLNNDTDNFIANTNPTDIYDGGFTDVTNYKKAAIITAVSFNDIEKARLTQFAVKIDKIIADNFDKIMVVPWKFALTEGDIYAKGLPHLRNDTIFLSTKTLNLEFYNDCQLGFTLLYMRQNMGFGTQITAPTLPWDATDPNWKYRDLLPTCNLWNDNAQLVNPYEYDISLSNDDKATMNSDNDYKALFAIRNNKQYHFEEDQYPSFTNHTIQSQFIMGKDV